MMNGTASLIYFLLRILVNRAAHEKITVPLSTEWCGSLTVVLHGADLPERYGPWETVYSRFRKWIEDGILDNIFCVLSLDAERSIVQAHQHSAGAKKGGLPPKLATVAAEQVPKSMPL